MPRFVGPQDVRFFQSINKELIDWVIETSVILYKVNIVNSDNNDIYGESINKEYYKGVKFNAIINRSNQESFSTNFGKDIRQPFEFAINRELLQQKNIVPENGDIVEWNNIFWEIDNVEENQYIAGRKLLNWSFVCQAHLTNASITNLLERHQ